MKPHDHYTRQIADAQSELKRVRQNITRISLLRVLLFTAGTAGIISLFHEEGWKIILTVCCTFLPFFILLKVHDRLFRRRDWLETLIRVNQEELQGLAGDNSCFEEGNKYTNPEHEYAFDLDVFGKRSLFQMINRTCTCFGEKCLAAWMQHHLTDKSAIEMRQEAVRDLSVRPHFREQFRVTGLTCQGQATDGEEIRQWCESPAKYLHAAWVKAFVWGVPLVNGLLLAAALFHIAPMSWFGLSFMLFVIISFGIIKRATAVQENYGKRLKTLNSYARLIALAKNEKWEASAIRQLMDSLDIDGKSPAEALTQLSKELDRLDLRNNQLLYVILEGSIFFQLQQIVRIERWKERYGKQVIGWLSVVGELDALCSLATFAYNHPEYTYPAIADKPFRFQARNMGHPLMPPAQCVKNDALIPSRPYFLIITGANMAGKSTYLRTIGTNYLLACIGAPACCDALTLYPARLVTSLRTSDSLSDNESYFFA